MQLYTTDDVPLCRRHVTKLEMRDSIHPRVRGLLQPAGAEERAKAGRYDTFTSAFSSFAFAVPPVDMQGCDPEQLVACLRIKLTHLSDQR